MIGLTGVAVTGYRREMIEARGVETITNEAWDRANMVGSLLCAMERIDPPYIVSYSDIVYDVPPVRRLIDCPHDLAITYDTDWRELWERRFEDALADAETFRIDIDGRVTEIGGKAARASDIEGQFMGLIRISRKAASWINDLVKDSPELRSTLDSTGLLMRLIEKGHPVHGVKTRGGWCEIDDQKDLAVAESLFAEGRLKFEYRE